MTLQLEKRRWWILAVIGLINLCAGSIYAWSVLAAASAAKLSSVLGTAVTPGDLAIAFGVANTVGPIPMILGGAINDRFGPRTVIVAGGFLMGLGLICCGLAESVGTLIAAYGGSFRSGADLWGLHYYRCTLFSGPTRHGRGYRDGGLRHEFGACAADCPGSDWLCRHYRNVHYSRDGLWGCHHGRGLCLAGSVRLILSARAW